MRIAFGSAFRNSGPRALWYLEQVARFRDQAYQNDVRVIAVEGDSTDNTRDVLQHGAQFHNLDLELRTCNHGGPEFGSTEQPARMVALSQVGNAIFDGVRHEDDVLVYVESDLRWQPDTILQLVQRATHYDGIDVWAPLIMAGTAFYDIWGFRGLDGQRWTPFWPFHPDCSARESTVEVSSVGSCLVMRGHVARTCRIENDYCLVGWCQDAKSKGFRIAVDLQLKVMQA